MKNLFLSFILLLSITPFILAQNKYPDNKSVSGSPEHTFLNLNNISTFFTNTGKSDFDEIEQHSGFKYPKETGKTAVFMSGLIWGVKIPNDPQVRVGGSTYITGLQGGKILGSGIAEDPNASHVRIYRIRPDVYPGGPVVDLSWEASDEGKTEQQIRTQYELDWNEWKADDGAPYQDIDNNGVYDPIIDVPGIKDAVQTIWFVANDLDSLKTQYLYGTDPIGIEYQATIWGYNNSGALDNLFFRKYKLINKSNTTFDSMYVSMWSDPDVGYAGDDFVGCDSLLNLGFAYNASASDAVYQPLPPPAVGFKLIRGPLVPAAFGKDINKNGIDDASDYGFTNNNLKVSGYINLPMTAFYYFAGGDPNLGDPQHGFSTGATQFYNFMQGKYGITGELFIDPSTNLPTTYALSGNPVSLTGWLDGINLPAGDRRLGFSTGPFQMSPGDTQTIVIAEIVAGATPGIDNRTAVSLLKYYCDIAQNFYDSNFPVNVSQNDENLTPTEFLLLQNYPNPFNPSTKISWQSPVGSWQTLKVYDILGNEVATLVNEYRSAGSYEVDFHPASSIKNPASGIYFYQLRVGDFVETKKMMLLK
jgi:hypothetical protein